MTGKEMWDMKLFEEKTIKSSSDNEWLVLRVPGGWVLRERNVPSPAYVFVSLNNEFLE